MIAPRHRRSPKEEEPMIQAMQEPLLCTTCQTEQHAIEAKGMCRRCNRIARKISQIENWNPNDESTLEDFPRGFILRPDHVSRMKADVLEQLKAHLEQLRIR